VEGRKEGSIMSTLGNPVALATAVATVLCVSTSFAQEVTAPTTSTSSTTAAEPTTGTAGTSTATAGTAGQTTTAPQPLAQPYAPMQQQPAQSVSVAPAAPAPQPIVVQQQPTSTTRTTAAPYYGTSGDRLTERTIEKRPNRALLSTGTGIFVLSYGASVVAGAVSDREEDKRLFIPVVGPWMDLAQRDCSGSACGGNEDLARAMIVTSGIAQGAGVLLALSSLIVPESTSVTERTTTAKAVKPKVTFSPVSYSAGAGVGAVGRF
jgi:hypothetical protein